MTLIQPVFCCSAAISSEPSASVEQYRGRDFSRDANLPVPDPALGLLVRKLHSDWTLRPYGMRSRMARVRGKVVSGVGDFGRWIEHLSSLYEQKTGMRLYPGTLNVQLPSEYSLPPDVIRLEAVEYGGRVSVSIVPCQIFNRRAFLLRTDQNEKRTGHHSRNIIEIATDVRLRDLYQLKDGDWVEVEVP